MGLVEIPAAIEGETVTTFRTTPAVALLYLIGLAASTSRAHKPTDNLADSLQMPLRTLFRYDQFPEICLIHDSADPENILSFPQHVLKALPVRA